MKHTTYKEWICLSLYDELNAGEMSELRAHLETCADCRSEMEEMQRVGAIMTHASVQVSDALLNEARAELHAALVASARKPARRAGIIDLITDMLFPRFRLALGGVAMAAVGIFIGYLLFSPPHRSLYEAGPGGTGSVSAMHGEDSTRPNETTGAAVRDAQASLASNDARDESSDASPLKGQTRAANIRIVHSDARTGDIEFVYDALSPMRVRGNINDERVQKILVSTLRDEENDGVRLKAVGMIVSSTETGTHIDPQMKAALIAAARNDANPAVRSAVLDVLKLYAQDVDIQKVLAYVLTNDKNSGVRVAAINILAAMRLDGVALDKSVLGALKHKIQFDKNIFIRNQSRNVLQEESQS